MRKDIDMPKVTGVEICIAKSVNHLGESEWSVYLINNNLVELSNVMIVSKGYDSLDKSGKITSTLRHMIQEVSEQSVAKVEAITPEVFEFYNEFWVSYYIVNELFDKKFIITPFKEYELEEIPALELQGRRAE